MFLHFLVAVMGAMFFVIKFGKNRFVVEEPTIETYNDNDNNDNDNDSDTICDNATDHDMEDHDYDDAAGYDFGY